MADFGIRLVEVLAQLFDGTITAYNYMDTVPTEDDSDIWSNEECSREGKSKATELVAQWQKIRPPFSEPMQFVQSVMKLCQKAAEGHDLKGFNHPRVHKTNPKDKALAWAEAILFGGTVTPKGDKYLIAPLLYPSFYITWPEFEDSLRNDIPLTPPIPTRAARGTCPVDDRQKFAALRRLLSSSV